MSQKSILLISNLYPNSQEATRGLFIKQLTDSFNRKRKVTVIAPLPFNPKELFSSKNKIPYKEVIDGVTVFHPRYIVIPKLFRSLTGYFMHTGISKLVKELDAQGLADMVSAHWVYPDGFAAVKAAKELGKPVAVHGLGCDINEYTKFKRRKKLITRTLNDSNINIVKSQELKDKITALGVDSKKTFVIHNGVDQTKFYPRSIEETRLKLGLKIDKPYALFVGNFQIEKGLTHLIEAIALLKQHDITLLVIGSGPMQNQMEALVEQRELQERVIFLGRKQHYEIPDYLACTNILCLPSLREGCPNVVLESLSCGTPVVASRVGAVPDILSKPEYGVMVQPEQPKDLADAIIQGLAIDKQSMPKFEWYNWDDNANKVLGQLDAM